LRRRQHFAPGRIASTGSSTVALQINRGTGRRICRVLELRRWELPVIFLFSHRPKPRDLLLKGHLCYHCDTSSGTGRTLSRANELYLSKSFYSGSPSLELQGLKRGGGRDHILRLDRGNGAPKRMPDLSSVALETPLEKLTNLLFLAFLLASPKRQYVSLWNGFHRFYGVFVPISFIKIFSIVP
jgi:hypothetical protein